MGTVFTPRVTAVNRHFLSAGHSLSGKNIIPRCCSGTAGRENDRVIVVPSALAVSRIVDWSTPPPRVTCSWFLRTPRGTGDRQSKAAAPDLPRDHQRCPLATVQLPSQKSRTVAVTRIVEGSGATKDGGCPLNYLCLSDMVCSILTRRPSLVYGRPVKLTHKV